MDAPHWTSLLPPLLAIGLAIATRLVHLSLFAGIWVGTTLLSDYNPLAGLAAALDACVQVFADAGNARVVAFSALVGSLIALTQYSGGVQGFVGWMGRRGLARTPRAVGLLSCAIGVVVFVESSITSLVNGAICRPLFDRERLSRAKLAYLCDATAAPVCVLIPLNAWGAYLAGKLTQEGYEAPVDLLLASLPLNFYALLTLVLAFWLAYSGRDFGPMRAAQIRAQAGEPPRAPLATDANEVVPPPGTTLRAPNFLLPIGVMVVMMPVGLFITGKGDPTAGSGSTSVLWAVLAGCLVSLVLLQIQRIGTAATQTDVFFRGMGGLVPVSLLMVLAFAMGDVAKTLGTGKYAAELAGAWLHPGLIPAVLFGLACFISFATGTSWGTYAIMLPVAVPLVGLLPGSDALVVAAVLAGGVFGDHCSPISDTTIISSMAAGCDHIEHVNTQLPYALVAGGGALALYLVLGLTW